MRANPARVGFRLADRSGQRGWSALASEHKGAGKIRVTLEDSLSSPTSSNKEGCCAERAKRAECSESEGSASGIARESWY